MPILSFNNWPILDQDAFLLPWWRSDYKVHRRTSSAFSCSDSRTLRPIAAGPGVGVAAGPGVGIATGLGVRVSVQWNGVDVGEAAGVAARPSVGVGVQWNGVGVGVAAGPGVGVAVSLRVGICIGGVGDGLFVSIDTLSSESGKVTNEDAISRVSSSCSNYSDLGKKSTKGSFGL